MGATSSTPPLLDLFVVGGGINGTGIANDAAGRGLSVTLCEQADLAQATSSASSKLIHGGLRYLESFELGLVAESLAERDILLKTAPHLVRLVDFFVPIYKQTSRRPWELRAGLSLYALLGRLSPPTRFEGYSAPHGASSTASRQTGSKLSSDMRTVRRMTPASSGACSPPLKS